MMNDNRRPEWYKPCKYCSQKIGFRRDTRSAGGFLIPLDESGQRHACANSDYQRRINATEGKEAELPEISANEIGMYFDDETRVLRAIEFIHATNNQLTGDFILTLERRPREGRR